MPAHAVGTQQQTISERSNQLLVLAKRSSTYVHGRASFTLLEDELSKTQGKKAD
jgi:hypothetical protein